MTESTYFDRQLETLPRAELETRQHEHLQEMLNIVLASNKFYQRKFSGAATNPFPGSPEWHALPFTSKPELVADAEAYPPYGSNLTYPLAKYIRLHQTSGTSGKPLVVLDTHESWENWKRSWGFIFRAAGVVPGDTVFVAFSFGLFIGFWPPFEAGPALGLRSLAGGAQNSLQRLKAIHDHQATVLLCTPSYALHLAEVARDNNLDLASSPVRVTIHAGEPGASIPSTKKRIQDAWGAKCFDHVGASEVGPYGFQCQQEPGSVHINELDYIVETLDPKTLKPVAPGELGELVITNLNRWGFPVIRYRTGDLVKLSDSKTCACGRTFRRLEGGILGRVDDMMTIRGVNVYPSAIESIVREFDDVAEFEGRVFERSGMHELLLKIEPREESSANANTLITRLQEEMQNRLGLRIEIEAAPPGSLPRYELKAQRFKRETS